MKPFLHCYKEHRFNAKTAVTVSQALNIITELQGEGYILTLRQLFYLLVGRGLLPNTNSEYKRLGRLVSRARESGVMDWFAIEDRGRRAIGTQCEEDTFEVVKDLKSKLVFDQWARQDYYLEVWVEKAALEGVIARPCSQRHVTYMACKGYLSTSEAWRAGLRFANAIRMGKIPILIHLADHDPSGIHMTADNRERIRLFAESLNIEVRRIALTMEQVEQYDPPPNPAKQTDSRYAAYEQDFGPKSWELDALLPSVLHGLILDTIDEYRDVDTWMAVRREQNEARRPLAALSANWDAVQEFMIGEGLV